MRIIAPIIVILALGGCGPSGPYLPCARHCAQVWDCPTGERQPACDTGLEQCLDDCSMADEP